MENQPRNELV